MPLKIVRNDITHVAADAIVNTANPLPQIGPGTDSAIHAAAGPALLEARRSIGPIAVGDCAATPAFGLPAKYVLHAVSPCWEGGQAHEAEALRRAYDSALALATRLRCRSVAFPLLAAGSYAFPHALALSIAVQAFTDYLMEHELTICLVLFDGKAFGLAASLFDDLKSYVDDHYVDAQHRREHPFLAGRRRAEPRPAQDLAREDAASGALGANEAADLGGSASMAAPQPATPSASGSLSDYLSRSEATFSEYLRDLLIERGG